MRISSGMAALCAISLLAVTTPVEAGTGKTIPVRPDEMHPLTFTRLVVNLRAEFELAIAPEKFGLSILEALREAGYNVVGGENLVFGVDESTKARMLLGGTIKFLKRRHVQMSFLDFCDITVEWEVFDKAANQVIYKKTSRARLEISSRRAMTQADLDVLVRAALGSLLSSPKFVEAVRKKASAPTATETSGPAAFRRCPAPDLSLPGEMDAVLAASATISAGGSGAGVFVSPDGVLLTAEHVVSGIDEVVVTLKDGRRLPGRVVRRDAERDVAVVRVDGAPEACVPVATAWPEVGQEVFAVGAPAGEEFSFSVTRGIVSGLPVVEGRKLIQTDASVNPGNSGGPLLDARGRLVGVVAGKVVGAAFEGMGFAVHADTALVWLGLTTGDETTWEAAGRAAIAPVEETVIDAPDPELPDPEIVIAERAAKTIERGKPARLIGGGAILMLASLGSFAGGAYMMAEASDPSEEEVGITLLAVGGAVMIGGVIILSLGLRKKRLMEQDQQQTKEKKVAFGLAPLDDGLALGFVAGF